MQPLIIITSWPKNSTTAYQGLWFKHNFSPWPQRRNVPNFHRMLVLKTFINQLIKKVNEKFVNTFMHNWSLTMRQPIPYIWMSVLFCHQKTNKLLWLDSSSSTFTFIPFKKRWNNFYFSATRKKEVFVFFVEFLALTEKLNYVSNFWTKRKTLRKES